MHFVARGTSSPQTLCIRTVRFIMLMIFRLRVFRLFACVHVCLRTYSIRVGVVHFIMYWEGFFPSLTLRPQNVCCFRWRSPPCNTCSRNEFTAAQSQERYQIALRCSAAWRQVDRHRRRLRQRCKDERTYVRTYTCSISDRI